MEPAVEHAFEDLTPFEEVVTKQRRRHSWPPETLAPGVILQARQHKIRDPKTQEVKETATYMEPCVEDSRLYYFNLSEHNKRPEDERNCPACNGAGYVRHGELAPNQMGFGATVVCPKWRSDAKRCVRTDHMGFER